MPPLPLPQAGQPPDRAREAGAVRLFALHAARVRPDFTLGEGEVQIVAEIVRRLDGLPLAIELAAGRVRLLPVRAILARLSNRLALLGGGPRDLPARQQTLRATLDWSHALLGDDEQALFARLGVFVGGWTLEAAGEVAGGGLDVLGGLDSLVEKSLVGRGESGGEARFFMLETLREYALEQLERRGEVEGTRRRHAEYFRHLAEISDPSSPGGRTTRGGLTLGGLQEEQPNFLAAIRWCLQAGETGLAAALFRALVHLWAARVDYAAEALVLAALGDPRFVGQNRAAALYAKIVFDLRRGTMRVEDGEALLALARGTPFETFALAQMGGILAIRGDDAGPDLLRDAMLAAERHRDLWMAATVRQVLVFPLLARGELEEAAARLDEASGIVEGLDPPYLWRWNLLGRGALHLLRGERGEARAALLEALRLGQEEQEMTVVSDALEALAALAWVGGDVERAARLWGTAVGLRRRANVTSSVESLPYAPALAALQERLTRPALRQAYAEGEGLDLAAALDYAGSGGGPQARSPASLTELTSREQEVLGALARGLSNKEIARELGISLHTVGDHLKAVFSKLGVNNRAAATRYALEHLTPAPPP